MDSENKESFQLNAQNMFSNKNLIITVLVILLISIFRNKSISYDW